PRTTCRVVCGFSVTIDTFSPTRRFSRVDFPEFGRPMMDAKPDLILKRKPQEAKGTRDPILGVPLVRLVVPFLFLPNQHLQSKTLNTPAVRGEYFDFDAAVLDFFARRGQTAE